MALSDWRQSFVDLTNDSEDDDDGLPGSLPVATEPTRMHVPLPTTSRPSNAYTLATQHTKTHVPLPGSTLRMPPLPPTVATDIRSPSNIATLNIASRPLTATSFTNMGRNSAVLKNNVPVSSDTYNGTYGGVASERAVKKMKMSVPERNVPSRLRQAGQQAIPIPATSNPTSGEPKEVARSVRPHGYATWAHAGPGSRINPTPRSVNKAPSVLDMNRALKTNGASVSFLNEVVASRPRAFQIGRITQEVDSAELVNSTLTTPQHAATVPTHSVPQLRTPPPASRKNIKPASAEGRGVSTQTHAHINAPYPAEGKSTTHPDALKVASKRNYSAGPFESSRDEDRDGVMSDLSCTMELEPPSTTDRNAIDAQPVPTIVYVPAAEPIKRSPGRKKSTNQFTEQQDHYLIFLKEVKLHSWKEITTKFNAEFPRREYHTLQSRYATSLNKRDRSQDPTVLNLPARFAAEATIDWQIVHANNPGPRARYALNSLQQDSATARQQAERTQRQHFAATQCFPIQQTTEQDYSSGADSAPRRERSRRAQRIDYTWPRHRRDGSAEMEEADRDEVGIEEWADVNDHMRSETPPEEAPAIPSTAVAVDNDPMNVKFEADDAELALSARKGPQASQSQLPYLTLSQQSTVRETLTGWEWDQLTSRQWQGCLLHVDFSPNEVDVVKKAIAKVKGLPQGSRHSTRRRQLRDRLRDLPEPKFLQLASVVRQLLPCRDKSSILAFLHDAKAGEVSDSPQVKRLAAARPNNNTSSIQKSSTASIIRQREIGHQSRRGWSTAAKPMTYQIKNKVMDTLGPAFSWTGAASDIHTVAWAPDGECFAAGAVAVDDPDSMQYNRPNNLLYGNPANETIHELGEHHRKRRKTENGANSTHAMFMSQDPKLYTTVSAVAFSTSGKLMFSAGYDETICVWHTDSTLAQPILGAKLNVRAQIDMMTVNRSHDGVLATAAKITDNKAVRLLTVNAENPSQFGKHSFHSSKAVSRTDLRILPTALQFEPRYGGLLLAGFGANVRDIGFDMTGDLCLWDVETQTQLHLHGSNRNVFDVEFNPNRSFMPLFAVGCVAGPNVNRGTRSVLRLYDEKVDRYWCPLEIECKAVDINDVIWCPHDEHLIAVGCTDGRAYVWDVRWPTDPVRTLSHGRSLMPLQDDVPYELTDTGVRFLSWGDNATRLYSGSSDGVVKVWDVTRADESTFIKDLITLDSGIMSGAFSPDKSKLVLGEVNGSVTVLEVGRFDCSMKDAERLFYVPYDDDDDKPEDEDTITVDSIENIAAKSGIAGGNHLLQSEQLQLAPMGSLPIYQVVQGPHYAGPYDQSVDAPLLREQALAFQQSMAKATGPQCDIAACKDNTNKMTSEEIGDSGRSADRIPDELRRLWQAVDSTLGIVPGKSKCTHCGRPARPPSDLSDADTSILCERCSFPCFRCGAVNLIAAATTTLICDSCAGVWDIGALGYDCVEQPMMGHATLDVPMLTRFGEEMVLERHEDSNATFGDELSALTDHYLGLAIDRPESPPL